jgi:hypothetical protein
MSPILGIIASANQQGRGGGPESAYDSLATVTVGATSVASITFTGIPSGYKHLQLRCLMKKAGTGNDSFSLMTLNSDTGNNYATHYLLGTGGVALAGANAPSVSSIYAGVTWGTGSSVSSSTFSTAIIDVLDYANTNKNTTVRTLTGIDGNGAGQIDLNSGVWLNTAAVTSINIAGNGGNFTEYSSFALYGVK